MRLDLPESLERVLSSTNLIENLFSRVRDTARRVKRWQGGTMILRWTAAGVLEAERHFRKIAGFRALLKLVAALHAHDATIDRARRVENGKRAAQMTIKPLLNSNTAADISKELAEIESPIAKHLYILAKANHLIHLRIGEYVALIAAADMTGHYGVGVLLEACLAEKLAFVERTRR
jgi:hypothetical protein